jgi:lipopolysaccharide/colanic/teichoic acid biosynthesis glycosyltransferase
MPTSWAMPDPGRTPSFPQLEAVEHAPAAPAPARPHGLRLKHALDRVGALVALVLALPVLAVAAAVAKLASSESVLVRERRIARDGSSFRMLAFAPVPVLRRFSVDQLPQLVNVLKGEMSFVGPRPERPDFVELFGANLRRHDQPRRVRPGVTGWSQLKELDGPAPLADRVRWDDWYVENWSLRLDLKIALMTVRDVWRGVAAASDG